jgi:hypothetical protein
LHACGREENIVIVLAGTEIKKDLPGRYDWRHMIGVAGVILVLGLYNTAFSFSFLPITEGWFSAYAHLMLDGKVPYRDFYLYLTPFYPMALAGIHWLFGDSFLVLRLIGMLVIISIAVLLYLILAKRFSPSSSMLASITASIYYQSGVAHITYDFTQVLTLFTLATTWMFVLAGADENLTKKLTLRSPIIRQLLLAGLFASLAFLTKQSNGAFVVLAASFGCIYLAIPWGRRSWKLFVAFGLGGIIPIIILTFWLFSADALAAFWQQIFGGALAAKGSLNHIVFAWFKGILTPGFVIQMTSIGKWAAMVVASSLVITKALSFFNNPFISSRVEFMLLGSFTLVSIVAVMWGYTGAEIFANTIGTFWGYEPINYIIPVAFSLAVILFVMSVLACISTTVRSFLPIAVSMLGIMSAGMIWGNGTSAGLSEVGVFTMLALSLAFMMEIRIFRYTGFLAAILLSISLIFSLTSKKFDMPYAWWGVTEPSVHEATHTSEMSIARGLKLSKTTAETFDTLDYYLSTGKEGDDIFAFPNIPIVYLIANRYPNSKVVVPWFDFLPDAPARAEAARILKTPPPIIVNLKLPSPAWDAHERLFRKGKPLGQRDIQAAIQELTEERKLYVQVLSKEVSPGSVLEIWHKKI